MKRCPNCSKVNRVGVWVCEHCGFDLLGITALDTRAVRTQQAESLETRTLNPSVLAPDESLVLRVEGAVGGIVVDQQQPATLGRENPRRLQKPHIDLTPYQALEKGVSSLHAMLVCQGGKVSIMDLDSTNGTYVEDHRLTPHQATPLYNDNKVRLGNLTISIHFERASQATD